MQTLGDNTTAVQNNVGASPSLIKSFLDFISNPETSIPLNSNFLMQFDIPAVVQNAGANNLGYEVFEPNSNDWLTLQEKRSSLIKQHNSNTKTLGAGMSFFGNGIVLPQESLGVERGSTILNGGILGGLYSSNRVQQQNIKTTFLETETSFIDLILRPWVIMTSHLGLIARGSSATVKTNLTIFIYSKYPKSKNQFIPTNDVPAVSVRKVYKFYGCAPVGISDAGYGKHDWGKNSGLPVAAVDWAYNYYTISLPEYSTGVL